MKESDTTLQPCPVCGAKTLHSKGDFETCDVCGWKDDPSQSTDPDNAQGANDLSLNEAQTAWQRKEKRRAASLQESHSPGPQPAPGPGAEERAVREKKKSGRL